MERIHWTPDQKAAVDEFAKRVEAAEEREKKRPVISFDVNERTIEALKNEIVRLCVAVEVERCAREEIAKKYLLLTNKRAIMQVEIEATLLDLGEKVKTIWELRDDLTKARQAIISLREISARRDIARKKALAAKRKRA
jgi:hypothetical protein